MKKFLLIIASAALMLSTASCNKSDQKSGDNSEKSIADTTATSKAADTTSVEKAPVALFTSADLEFFGLKGKVKCVTVTNIDDIMWDFRITGNNLNFDEKGILISGEFGGLAYKTHNDYSFPATIKRNKDGYFKTMQYLAPGDVESIIYKFKYDNNGRVNKGDFYAIESWKDVTYTYNDMGLLSSTYYECHGEGSTWQDKLVYNYSEFDSHGNWTKVEINYTEKFQDCGESKSTTESKKYVVHRTITYY